MGDITYIDTGTTKVQDLAADVANRHDEYEYVVFVGLKKTDEIDIGHTPGDTLGKVGILQVASDHIMNMMRNDY